MHRIDNSSAVAVRPAPLGSHTPGYFDPGDPVAERDATILDYFWANTVQEELAAIVEQGAGGALDPSNDNQVLAAIRSLIAAIPHGYWAYANTGSSTNFVVPAGVTTIDVELWGGGAGAYARRRIAVTPGQSIPVTIGAAVRPAARLARAGPATAGPRASAATSARAANAKALGTGSAVLRRHAVGEKAGTGRAAPGKAAEFAATPIAELFPASLQ